MTETEEKYQYARLLLKYGGKPYDAAFKLHPHDSHRAMWVIMQWGKPNDFGEFIDAELTQLYSEAKAQLKTDTGKDEDDIYLETQLRDIIEKSNFARDRIEALKLFAKIKGKENLQPATAVNIYIPKVIEKETFGDDTAWEAACEKQQATLQGVTGTKH